MASNSKPLIEIEQSESNDFSIKINSTFVKKCTLFKVGQDFEEKQMGGYLMKINSTLEDNKLVMNYEPLANGEGKPQKHTREVSGDIMTLTLEIEDVVAKRFFKKQ